MRSDVDPLPIYILQPQTSFRYKKVYYIASPTDELTPQYQIMCLETEVKNLRNEDDGLALNLLDET
jgi:hypothetical protein